MNRPTPNLEDLLNRGHPRVSTVTMVIKLFLLILVAAALAGSIALWFGYMSTGAFKSLPMFHLTIIMWVWPSITLLVSWIFASAIIRW